jgi:hypothetical protein
MNLFGGLQGCRFSSSLGDLKLDLGLVTVFGGGEHGFSGRYHVGWRLSEFFKGKFLNIDYFSDRNFSGFKYARDKLNFSKL